MGGELNKNLTHFSLSFSLPLLLLLKMSFDICLLSFPHCCPKRPENWWFIVGKIRFFWDTYFKVNFVQCQSNFKTLALTLHIYFADKHSLFFKTKYFKGKYWLEVWSLKYSTKYLQQWKCFFVKKNVRERTTHVLTFLELKRKHLWTEILNSTCVYITKQIARYRDTPQPRGF